MNKILAIAVMVMAAAPARAGGAALQALGGLAGSAGTQAAVPAAPGPEEACKTPGPGASVEEIIAWIRCVQLPAPPAAPALGADKRTLVHPKIAVSPVTASWRDAALVMFRRVSLDTVKSAMEAAGDRPWVFGENDGAFIVRLDIADAEAPSTVRALAAHPAVERVEVNRTVYAALQAGREKASQARQAMKVYRKGPAILAEVEAANGRQYIAAFRADGPAENLPYLDVNIFITWHSGGAPAVAGQRVRAMWTKNGFMAPPVNAGWLVPEGGKISSVRLAYKLDAHTQLDYVLRPGSERHETLLSDEPAIIGIAPDLIAKLKAYIAK